MEVATKIYVGGIPYYSTEDDIRSYFEGCGTITEVDCMKFPESGKFRGIAIINFKVVTFLDEFMYFSCAYVCFLIHDACKKCWLRHFTTLSKCILALSKPNEFRAYFFFGRMECFRKPQI